MTKPLGVAITNEVEYVDEKRKLDPDHFEQAVLARLTGEDILKLSRESLTLKSWAGLRTVLIMFVEGCN